MYVIAIILAIWASLFRFSLFRFGISTKKINKDGNRTDIKK